MALAGLLPGKSVSRSRAFRPDSCPGEKEPTSLSAPAARPVDSASPPRKGPLGRAAGHRGPHSVMMCRSEAEQQPEQGAALHSSFCFEASTKNDSPRANDRTPRSSAIEVERSQRDAAATFVHTAPTSARRMLTGRQGRDSSHVPFRGLPHSTRKLQRTATAAAAADA